MQFLKTLFWVLLAVLLVLFAKANWIPVELKLWGDIIVEVRLPFLLLIIFALGFLPPFLVYRARLWNLRRRAQLPERRIGAPERRSADDAHAPAEDSPVI